MVARYMALNNLYIQAEKEARESGDGDLKEKWEELAREQDEFSEDYATSTENYDHRMQQSAATTSNSAPTSSSSPKTQLV